MNKIITMFKVVVKGLFDNKHPVRTRIGLALFLLNLLIAPFYIIYGGGTISFLVLMTSIVVTRLLLRRGVLSMP